MKLLSLWEPWATLMAIGAKRIETRSWSTSYRGWLAIHASKGGLAKRELADCLQEPEFAAALNGTPLSPGCIVAVVRLEDCVGTHTLWTEAVCERCDGKGVYTGYLDGMPGGLERYCSNGSVFIEGGKLSAQEREFGDYHEGRFGWITTDLFRIPKPIPYRAKQGLVEVDSATLELIREQWRESKSARMEATT